MTLQGEGPRVEDFMRPEYILLRFHEIIRLRQRICAAYSEFQSMVVWG